MSEMSAIDGLNASSGVRTTNPKSKLQVEDFINMMVTQLQNQDPMEPAKNEQLLAQMSQIGQLQSQQELTANQKLLTTSIQTMVLQNNIGAASNLIGKDVKGVGPSDAQGNSTEVSGTVEGVTISDGKVLLKLSTNVSLALEKVTDVESDNADLAQAAEKSAGAKIAA